MPNFSLRATIDMFGNLENLGLLCLGLRLVGFKLDLNLVSLLGKNWHCYNGVFTTLGNSDVNIY